MLLWRYFTYSPFHHAANSLKAPSPPPPPTPGDETLSPCTRNCWMLTTFNYQDVLRCYNFQMDNLHTACSEGVLYEHTHTDRRRRNRDRDREGTVWVLSPGNYQSWGNKGGPGHNWPRNINRLKCRPIGQPLCIWAFEITGFAVWSRSLTFCEFAVN